MKKVLLAGIIALIMSSAALNAQTWQIGYPNAADLTATLTGDTLTINGTGAMKDFTYTGIGDTNAPWNSVRNTNLATLIINPGVTSIGTYAFYGCNGPRAVNLPNTIISIGAHAFESCGNLFSMTFSNSLQSIGDFAFSSVPLRTVTIPQTVVSIAGSAFSSCYALSSIDVDNANPSYSSKDGVLFDKGKTTLIYFPQNNISLSRSYTIPSSVTSIGDYAFYSSWLNYTLTSITIPNSVTSIGNYAFYDLQLTQISLPDHLTKIGNGAFQYCIFNYIKFPKSLTNLGGNLFGDNNNLKYVEVEWDTPLAIASDVFSGVTLSSCNLIVPTGKSAVYKAANVWKNFGSIKEQVPVTGITLNRTSATLTMIATLQLTANVTPSNATYPDVVWTSSNAWVASVSATGLVKPNNYGSVGTTVITATTRDGGYSDSCTVTVQYGDGAITGLDASITTNYSYNTISGFNDSIACLDFSNGPFDINISHRANSQNAPIKVYLCIPKKSYTESFPSNSTFRYYKDGVYNTPTLDDVDKIKEIIVDMPLTPLISPYSDYYENTSILWDGMTDPAFTNGISYPVQDNVYFLVTDARTGDALSFSGGYHITRYKGKYAFTYTPKEHSVVCDLYFSSQLPVKKAVPFFGYDCIFDWANPALSAKGGIEKTVLSLLQVGNFSISAYQLFDNPPPDKNGIYHLSWEIKDLQGKFFDAGKVDPILSRLYGDYGEIALYVEGDRQETVNLGVPEYGGEYHGGPSDYLPVSDVADVDSRIPPRPLNPNATVSYPEFEIENGALLHYHGSGGNVVIPASVDKINALAFFKCTNLNQVTIPVGVTSIGDYAFYGCTGLTSVTIPNSVTSIGDAAFYGCGSLTSFTIPNSVTSIGDVAFASTNLSSLTIPNSITSIGDGAFAWCNNLKDVFVNWATPLVVPSFITDFNSMIPPSHIFYNVNTATLHITVNSTLHIPIGTKALYQAADVWKDFVTIKEEGVAATGIVLNQTSAKLAVGSKIQLAATVSPDNATYKDVSWSSSNNNIATVSADGTVTGIMPGTATITATALYGNFKATCIATVIDINYTGFMLNGGDKVALFPTVDLNFSFNGSAPTQFMVSENSNFNGSVWQEYNPAALKYTFASSESGTKTVYAKLKNGTGETEAKSSNILYKPAHSITQVNMYPSPAENTLNVELTSEFTNFKVEVYTSTGGLLLSQQLNNPVFTLDISSCPSGILIVKITDNKTGTTVERTIIKH